MFGFFFEKDEPDQFISDNAGKLIETPYADAIRASVANSIRNNSPLDFVRRTVELSEAKRPYKYVTPERNPEDPYQYGRPIEGEYHARRVLTKEEANAEFGIPGQLNFDGSITEDAAKIIKARKEEELEIQSTLDKATGVVKNSVMFGTELVASLLDPVNFAANFIPVIGEARMAQLVSRYGRHGARIIRGALEGLTGQAVIEPFAYGTHNYEMSDYSMYMALQSLSMGAIGGSVLHEGFGAVGDAVRGLKRRTVMHMHKTAVGQLADGKNVNVAPLVDHDPNVVSTPGSIDEGEFLAALKAQHEKALAEMSGVADEPKSVNLEKELVDEAADAHWKFEHSEELSPEAAQAKHALLDEPDVDGPLTPEINVESDLDLNNLEQVGPQLGSNKGGSFVDKTTGIKWYVKWMNTYDHVRNEMLVNLLYRLVGLDVPELRIVREGDKFGIASRWIDDTTPLTKFDNLTPEQLLDIQKGFVADAWLANWDVLDGLEAGNLHLTKDGKVVRIDQGGGLKYRAAGEPKNLSLDVKELETMKDPNINYKGSQVFGKMIDEVLQDSAGDVFKISKADIEKALTLAGYAEGTSDRAQVASLLYGRLHDLELKLPLAAKAYHYKNNTVSTMFTKEDSVNLLKSYIETAKKNITDPKVYGALEEYQGGSSFINKWLRGIQKFTGEHLKQLKAMKGLLDKAMEAFTFPTRTTVWRGIDWRELGPKLKDLGVEIPEKTPIFAGANEVLTHDHLNALLGKVLDDKGFMSTSVGGKSNAAGSRPIQLRLEVPQGYHAAFPNVSRYASKAFLESEVEAILPRNTEYLITRAYFVPWKNNMTGEKSTALMLEGKVLPKKGPVAKKQKTAKVTPEQTLKEVAAYHKQPSNAADPEPMNFEPGLKEPNEVVKPAVVATEKPVSPEINTVAMTKEITDLERQIALLEDDLQTTMGLKKVKQEELGGTTNPEIKTELKEFVDDLMTEIDMYDSKINTAKEKLNAIKTAFNCVVENL